MDTLHDAANGGSATPAGGPVRLLYCRCAFAQVIPADVKDAVLDGFADAGVGFEAVSDLCEMAAHRDPHLVELAKGPGTLRIAACWPRAVRGLFHLADAPLPAAGVEILNMRTLPAERVLAGVLHGDAQAIRESEAAASSGEATPGGKS
jgi:hypothetical protein